METPMFISASQNTTQSLFGADVVYNSSNGGPHLLSQGCVYANEAESVTNGRDFFPSVMCTEGESETAHSERLFMIYWFYKRMSWWIFTIIGWMFSHTAATQLCSNSL